MAEFISTFTTGFSDVVAAALPSLLRGAGVLSVYDGLVRYKFNGNPRDIEKIRFFNNTFFVIAVFHGKKRGFPAMVSEVAAGNHYYLISRGKFRIRFVSENRFVHVPQELVRRAESAVTRNSRLSVDRVNPGTEIWYDIRREGFAFCGELISKRAFTEKNLAKGELRPEFAYLMCLYAEVREDDVAADPFAGSGAIPVQLARNFRFRRLYAGDVDGAKIPALEKRLVRGGCDYVEVLRWDAMSLAQIPDGALSLVITDPPWGFYEEVGDMKRFCLDMFASFRRVLRPDGRMVILSARTEEIEAAAAESGVSVVSSVQTLVNGRKASVYRMRFEPLQQ